MRVLIAGSRSWADGDAVHRVLDEYLKAAGQCGEPLTVIEGCAQGADWFAHTYKPSGLLVHHAHYPADWKRYGKSAGPIRNRKMLLDGMPDVVVAFSADPITRGTADMVKVAEQYNVPVVRIAGGKTE